MEYMSHVVEEAAARSGPGPTKKHWRKDFVYHSKTGSPALIVGGHRVRYHHHRIHSHHRKHPLKSDPFHSVTGHREEVDEMRETMIASGKMGEANLGLDLRNEYFSTWNHVYRDHFRHHGH